MTWKQTYTKKAVRKGFIRHDLQRLSKIWKIPYQTLNDNLTNLIKKKVIVKESDTPKVPDFDRFTPSGENQIAKQKYTNEELERYFDNLFPNSEIPLQTKRKNPSPFNTSSKDSFKSVNEDRNEFTDSDKKWINMSQLEQDVLEVFLNNNFELYQQSIID